MKCRFPASACPKITACEYPSLSNNSRSSVTASASFGTGKHISSIMAVVPGLLMPATVGKVSFLTFQRVSCLLSSVVNSIGNKVLIYFMLSEIDLTFASSETSSSPLVSTNSAHAPSGSVFKNSGIPGAWSTDFIAALSKISAAETGCCLMICTALQASLMVGYIIRARDLNLCSTTVLYVMLEINASVPSEPIIKCLIISIPSS